MRSRYKVLVADAPHFITSTIVEWLPVFTKKKYLDLMIRALQYARKEKGLKVHAYVILENHLHLIVSGMDWPKTIKEFKSFTAREILQAVRKDNLRWLLAEFMSSKKDYKGQCRYQIWQEGFHPKALEDEEVFLQKLEYIHYNPVKRGYVERPEHWVYSSARNYISERGVMEIDFLEV